jgi:hypothetical protein
VCRINLFYEDSYCLSLDCLDSEDDVRELVTRMQNVAPRLTASHEVREGREGGEGRGGEGRRVSGREEGGRGRD